MERTLTIHTFLDLSIAIKSHKLNRAQIDLILNEFKYKPIILDDSMTPDQLADELQAYHYKPRELKPLFIGIN